MDILKIIDGKVQISNKIFGERIYNYMISKLAKLP